MKNFYNQVLGFRIENDLDNYVEFENDGARFAICMRDVMYVYSSEYRKESFGQGFELAFPCENPNDVDESFKKLISKGATSVHEPQDYALESKNSTIRRPRWQYT